MAMASSAAFTTDAAASTSGEAPPSRQVKTNPSIFCFLFQVLLFLYFFPPFWFMRKEGRNSREGFLFYYVTFVFLHINKLGDVSGNASTSSTSSSSSSSSLVMFLIMISVLLVCVW